MRGNYGMRNKSVQQQAIVRQREESDRLQAEQVEENKAREVGEVAEAKEAKEES